MNNPIVNRVAIADFDMKFSSMVYFMVKWAIASIPAAIILAIFCGAFAMLLMMAVAAIGLNAH
jgi:hypothetical protein